MTDVPLYEEEDDVSWAHTLNFSKPVRIMGKVVERL